MVSLTVLNLILYNFLEHHIKWAIIFNCWNMNTQVELTEILMANNMYVQLWNINRLKLEVNINGHYVTHNSPHIGIFFDFNCAKGDKVLNKTSQEKLFTDRFHWLIYDDNSNVTKFRQQFKHYNMAVDADVNYVFPNQALLNSVHNFSYLLYDVYNNGYNLGGKLNMTPDKEIICSRKQCELKEYLSTLHEKSKYENRWYLGDIKMRVSTVVTKLPFTEDPQKILNFLASEDHKHIDGVARFGFGYLMILKDTLGCDFAYNFTNAWSVTLTEGGIFGAMTIEQTAEIGSSPLTLARGRFPLAQPTIAMGNFRQVCIFRTPRNSGIRGEVYLKPFASIVWIFLVAIITMTAILLWITFKVESSKLKIYLRFIPSLLTSGLIAFGSACCQGSFLVPRSMGGRVAFFSLSLLTFIIYNYYTSIVVAILLGSPVKSNIKTLLQLGESNLGMAIEPIPYTKMYINTSNDPAIRSIVRNKIQPLKDPQSIWMPINEGLHRIHDDPGFVYVTDTFASYDLIERSFTAQEICDTNEILFRPEQLLYEQMHRNSSYREFVKIKQLRILESGVHRRHEGKWIKKRLHCYLSSGVLLQVGLEYTAPLFIMMASVYGLVIILLLMEICWFKYWKGVNVARFMTFGKN